MALLVTTMRLQKGAQKVELSRMTNVSSKTD